MTQDLNSEIEKELTTFSGQTFNSPEGSYRWLKEAFTRIAEKTVEAVRVGSYVAPHVPPEGFESKYPRCGDCFCTEQDNHTHSEFIREQNKKASAWLGEENRRKYD